MKQHIRTLIVSAAIIVTMASHTYGMDDQNNNDKKHLGKGKIMSGSACQEYEGILTCDKDLQNVLRTPTPTLSKSEWDLARGTAQKLIDVRENTLGGGAGLAAPQIGIKHPIFIFTSDRTTANLKVVINPTYEPVGTNLVDGVEACFSAPLRCTEVERWETIKVKYQDLEGNVVEAILDGFAAKVFQHEMDHLKGKLTIDHETARVLTFSTPETFEEHMKQVRREDSKRYEKKE